MQRASSLLGEDGPFCESLDGYQVRDNQIALCDAIEDTLKNDDVLAAEAGTGIGKTYAYLVPALLSGKKVIISTGTRHLQDQLFLNDLPRVLKTLGLGASTALLKGRNNYLCLHRLKLAPHLGFMNRQLQGMLTDIDAWSKQTQTGDVSELSSIAEDAYVWPMVTSTADNCIGGDCDHWDSCFINKARKKALSSDVVVINHHLLLADMTLKTDGFAELLPEAEAFIIDEAHQLYDVAARFFGDTVSSRQLILLARDVIAEQVNEASDMAELKEYADDMEKVVRDLRIALGETGLRDAWIKIRNKPVVSQQLNLLITALDDLIAVLEIAAERSRGLEHCYERAQGMAAKLRQFASGQDAGAKDASGQGVESVQWYETYSKSFMLHATPIDVASIFREHTDDYAVSWVFTSATLQVNRQFEHFAGNLGLQDYHSGTWQSPFDYPQQSLLYLPENMPQPSEPAYIDAFVDAVIPVLKASRGRAFLLFTSYYAMNKVRDKLRRKVDYEMFVQGDLPKHQLLEAFRESGHAILLGTSSFWEGVDVRGESLSCVIIDKLPFASPGDPVMQARIDMIKRRGGQPFMEFQVPQAVIALKQGVGRLIRDVNDYGVVMITDPRLSQKTYGSVFLNSLPDMPRTSTLQDVQAFYAARDRVTEEEAAV